MVSEEKNGLAECAADVERAECGAESDSFGENTRPERENCEKQSPVERCTRDSEGEVAKRSSYKNLGRQLEETRAELETEKKRSEELLAAAERLEKSYKEAVELIRRMHYRECELVAALGSLSRVLSYDFEAKTEG